MHTRQRPHLFSLTTLALSVCTALIPAVVVAQTAGAGAMPSAAERAARLNALLSEGKFGTAGSEGLAWLQSGGEQPESALRLKIANSLAWTNRLPQAIDEYEKLIRNSDQFQTARLPLANAYRWTGQTHLAIPLYRQALDENENNLDALDGLEYAERELRPRTTIQWSGSKDSGDLRLSTGTITHRWRDASTQQIYEVEADLRTAHQAPGGPDPRHTGATVRYAHMGLPYEPEVSVGVQGQPTSGLFGSLRVKLGEWPVHAEIAHENFGMTSASAKALDAGLTANRIGLEAQWGGELGVLSGKLNVYDISDNNSLRTTSIKLAPSWRPLGLNFKPYTSIDTRDLKFNTPNYWSPSDGSGTLGLGATAEWSEKDWYFVLAGQLGTRIYGEAGSSWSASIGAQRWLNRETAVTANLWGMSSIRDGARYKAHSLSLKLDRLW